MIAIPVFFDFISVFKLLNRKDVVLKINQGEEYAIISFESDEKTKFFKITRHDLLKIKNREIVEIDLSDEVGNW